MHLSRSASLVFALTASALVGSTALAQGGGREGDQPPGDRGFSPEAFVDRMMQGDANGDGKLAPDEVQGRFAEQMFETGDTDKDGFLTRDELRTYFENRPRGFGQPQPPPGEGGPAGTVDSHMRQAGQALRALRRSPFNVESQAGDLTRIGVIQASLVGAKAAIDPEHMAPQAKAKYGEDKAAYVKAMRLSVIKAIKAAIALEESILAGDSDGSRAALDKMLAVQKEGHDQFQEEQERGPRRPAPGDRPGRGGEGGGGGGRGGEGGN